MTRKSARVSEFIKDLDLLVDKISKEPPVEISDLDEESALLGSSRYGRILQANTMLRELAVFLDCLGNSAKEGVSVESLIFVTTSLLETDSVFAVCIGLTSTPRLLGRACSVLREVESLDEYVQIVGRLRFYLNKMSAYGWIDNLLIHAAEMGLVYDLLFPPSGRTKTWISK
jgi:hypothetical protein